jgi:hypothetical protein
LQLIAATAGVAPMASVKPANNPKAPPRAPGGIGYFMVVSFTVSTET